MAALQFLKDATVDIVLTRQDAARTVTNAGTLQDAAPVVTEVNVEQGGCAGLKRLERPKSEFLSRVLALERLRIAALNSGAREMGTPPPGRLN
jgi:hypothetical protein